ncbi:MAG TPA: hypothetical protein VFA41_12140 [Ktedonobacteraceae bacterium]|jgi:hypothetical protein|nr:hypothetical protein [Ktedonobacteraceae bacterium]
MTQNTSNSMGQVEMQQCAQDCLTCSSVCSEAAKSQGANSEMASMLQDCAELCQVTAHFLQHNSQLSGYVCQACARVCDHCANMCEQAGNSDCANACRNAAWSCGQMAKMVA